MVVLGVDGERWTSRVRGTQLKIDVSCAHQVDIQGLAGFD